MTKHDLTDAEFEAFFAAAREVADTPDPAFLDRLAAQAEAAVTVPVATPAPRRVRLHDLLGGWQAMGGLALATCAGVWIGVSPPTMLPDPADYVLSLDPSATYETMILNPESVWDEAEG